MRRMIMILIAAGMILGMAAPCLADTIAMPDGSITTPAGTYGMAYHFFDTAQNPMSPDRWDVVASDLTFEGQVNISDINAKARWNTWDDDTSDAVDKLGVWYMCGPYAGTRDAGNTAGCWWTSPQWTGGDDLATDIRQIFHMQDRQGTQPDPKWHTGPYTDTDTTDYDGRDWSWLDDWFNFKLVIHATSDTTGTAQLWIHDELVEGQGQTSPPPIDTFNFDISEATDDLTNMRVIMWMINGNNPNNPDYTLDWRNVSVTGTPVPEPATLGLLALGGVAALVRRRRK